MLEEQQENLKLIGGKACIVKVAEVEGLENCSKILLLEDLGTCLNRFICNGRAGKELACVVYRDIWNMALLHLKLQGLCHPDVRNGNICIRVDTLHATHMGCSQILSQKPLPLQQEPLRQHANIKNRGANHSVICTTALEIWNQASV